MAQLKVGDTVRLCSSIYDFCGTYSQLYYIGDINLSIYPNSCPITIYGGTQCIPLSGILLEFQWVNSIGTVETHQCQDTVRLKVLGSAYTNSQGVASVTYTITQDDLNIFNANTIFDLRVCIKNKSSSQVIAFGDVRSRWHTDSISIIQNLCAGVTCPDICIGNDLYYQTCDPVTGNCIQGTLKEANSTICTATHYIEYDLGFLPQEFLDLIGPTIVEISTAVGEYITPLVSSNIIYRESAYSSPDKKFRIYVHYTPALTLSPETIQDYRWIYNSSTGRIEKLALVNTLPPLAGLVAAIGIFILLYNIVGKFGIYAIAASAIVAIVGAVLVSFVIHDVLTGSFTSGTTPEPTPKQKVETVKEYVETYQAPDCDILWPTCAAIPPTCDAGTMRAYLGCVGPARWSQCKFNHVNAGETTTDCDTYAVIIQQVDACLANGTCSPAQAKDRIINEVVNPVKSDTERIIQKTTCGSGLVYNKDTQKCESACYFPVLGFCFDTILVIGGALVGGYVIYKIATRPKPQQMVIKTEK